MKKILFLAALLTATITSHAQTQKDFGKLHWLAGTWQSTNNKPGEIDTETWQIASTTTMTGTGITLKGKDTVFVEHLQLVVNGNAIYYMARVGKSLKAVPFKLTQITADSFTCENPEHDFPKKITYQLEGNRIKAAISGDGKAINYEFVKLPAHKQ
ncbi:hypothetical protein C8P68_10175 [Mucilaginibacter yixingensis]|uniref:DUF6265 domain-containing protein n=1 Tax=Mucilaginibacter yixingensis TaxID=1295612 RepID=A0A2T5JEI0_9SPHI|nr:DUF6265 family protein [Mucilaginibacter yixingensis]PTR00847.1 hypothetical protein C8P68_10175 [Mucilaginibacter yixingensis]